MDASVAIADAIRELVMSFSAFAVGLTVVVAIALLRVLLTQNRERNTTRLIVMLTCAALTFALLHVGVIEQAMERFGTPLTWRTPFYLISAVLSNVALGVVGYLAFKRSSKLSIEERAERVQILIEIMDDEKEAIKQREKKSGH